MKNFDIDVELNVIAKKSPEFEEVKFKSTAGNEQDLIERHTIGKFDEESEEDETEQQSDL